MSEKLNFQELSDTHLNTIYNLCSQMAAIPDADEMLNFVLSRLMEETGAEVGAFIYFDPIENKFIPRTIQTTGYRQSEDINFSQTVFNDIREKKQAILTFDTRSDNKYANKRSVLINEIFAILAFPLIIKNELYGIIYFDSRKNRQSFNETARQFLSFFSIIASLTLQQALSKKEIENENILLKSQINDFSGIPEIIGQSPEMKQLFTLVHKIAKTDASVIITGENGTGKDLIARAIYNLSHRKDKPFIAQYIGNIPGTILESELFGYKKGAFTGANKDKIGLFEAVNNGTLFLDEIGDLSLDLQTKLLRVLQNKEIKRLGENIVRHVDVRIIVATNQDLEELVRTGKFREDLYYRLNVISLLVPPLRERKSDIPLLVEHFISTNSTDKKISIEKDAIRKLMNYDWPGNVRQLENIIKRASILAQDGNIREDGIHFDSLKNEKTDEHFSGTIEELKSIVIAERIKLFKGNKTHAAKSLGISLRSIQAKAKELGL